MKKTKNRELPFPPPKGLSAYTKVCQIGRERFAIHIEIEDLPPVMAPLLLMKPPLRKGNTQQGFSRRTTKDLPV